VDSPASDKGDSCGIIVCGALADGRALVLADCSVEGERPEGWARAVKAAAETWGTERVVAEVVNGGQMVESVLRAAAAGMPVTPVHASRGKAARAEPVALLFETGRCLFAGAFPELEDELTGFSPGGFAGRGSPDRADAMVWAMTELTLKPRGMARVRAL
jgi:phage terminase large subunit-like protein